ncbi:thyrotropin-releasing hormone receptor [Folsomia candida]|nr:thyrotropin-releasing hormone receptor [Folsomia candida]
MDNFTLISLEFNKTTSYGSDVVDAMYGVEGGSIVTTSGKEFMSDDKELPYGLRVICIISLFLIFTIGAIGNLMVIVVIGWSRDMRTSTNIFLVNLSIADMLVLIVCAPTFLIEVTHHPDRWILGYHLCKFIPLLEAVVANASVLTVLSLCFERYYAICRPLRANYICTKSRAVCISVAAWVFASFITSPMIFMTSYSEGVNERDQWTARCDVMAGSFWADFYTISTIILLFMVPCVILLVTYGVIANRLRSSENDHPSCNVKNENHKARKQVVVMLFCITILFFIFLIPFRILTLFVLLADTEVLGNHIEAYNYFLYSSRIMLYLNSCCNPILYNLFSSKFRSSFLRLCNRHRKPSPFTRNGTFLTNTTNSTNQSINLGHQSGLVISTNGKKGSDDRSPELNGSLMLKKNGVSDGKTLKNYLLSQSHSASANGFLISHRTPGALYNGIGTTVAANGQSSFHPFQKSPPSSSVRGNATNSSVKMHKLSDLSSSSSSATNSKSGNNNYTSTTTTFGGTMSIKSDAIYSAYIPGRRSETVL